MQQARGQGLDFLGLEIRRVVDVVHPGAVIEAVAAQVDGQGRGLVAVGDFHRRGRRLAVAVVQVFQFVGQRQLEQLRAVFAQQAEGAVEFAQGKALVAEVLFQYIAHRPHQGLEAQFAAEVHAHRADLGEGTQGHLEGRIGAVQHRHAQDPFVPLQVRVKYTCSAASST